MTSTSTYSNKSDSDDRIESPAEVTSENSALNDSELTEAPPAAPRSTLLHGAEPAAGQVRVAMSQLSLRQVEGHALQDLSRELGGVLLGEAGSDEDGHFVKVRASLPVRTADHGPVHFTFTADSWAQLHEERGQRYPELDIVGWYHTHPNLGVFYSADDVVVHRAAFVMPWQVGLVYDPVRGEGCLVGWQGTVAAGEEGNLVEINGYYELLDEQIGSVVTWQFLRSSVWREGAYRSEAMPRTGQVYAPSNAQPALPPISPWWGVLIGGLSLLLSLLLLIDRLLASTP
jgi:proteasome lid subunit RPN8/RPN11